MMKNDDQVIQQALSILRNRLRQPGTAITSPSAARSFLTLKMAELEHEVFTVLFLDNQHRVIDTEDMARGTIDAANVYPREIVKAALLKNAAAVVLAHNHPSGIAEPSIADRNITDRLVEALGLIDVRVLDHIIVGGDTTMSFAERGLI